MHIRRKKMHKAAVFPSVSTQAVRKKQVTEEERERCKERLEKATRVLQEYKVHLCAVHLQCSAVQCSAL